jgi:4-hydroxy-tetrahydrodipicolinate reductase
MIKVGVVGAGGRMGTETCRAVQAEPGLELVARVSRGVPLEVLTEAAAEVAVDFTVPSAVAANAAWYLDHGLHAVIGTTGLTDDDVADLDRRARAAERGCLIAPNFALGAVLMMRFAQQAASHFERAEIVERHHERKLDAPSGTALRTARLMAEARAEPFEQTPDGGARGLQVAGVRIHSLRLPGSVAHQEVVFGGAGETLTIRHDSLDRSAFMPGVLLAIRRVAQLKGAVVGLEHLLEL